MVLRALTTIWLLLAIFASAIAQEYTIDRFHAQLDLRKDGKMVVEEKIDVTFNIERRGIFRFIPVSYDTGKGRSRRVYLNVGETRDESGRQVTQKVTREGPFVRIRLGDEDIVFPPGTKKQYTIRYEVSRMLNWFDKMDDWTPSVELYWNITGDQWDVGMGAITATVNYPEADIKQTRARVFLGGYGSRNYAGVNGAGKAQDPVSKATIDLSPGTIQLNSNRPTGAGEGMTIVLDLPAKTIPEPSATEKLFDTIRENLGYGIPLLALLGLPALWYRFGRDPFGGPMVVQYEPPDGISGPEAGTLLDEHVDLRDLSSGIIDLAIRGHLKIIPKEEGLIFKKRTADLEILNGTPSPGLNAFEQKLLRLLAASGPIVTDTDLRSGVAPHLSELRNSIYNSLVSRGYYRTSPETARVAWGIGGTVVVILLGVLTAFLNPIGEIIPSIVGSVIGVILVWVFSKGMPRRTKMGSLAHAKVKGFEDFVRRAQGGEIEHAMHRQMDMHLFEEYLPHAIAFGLAKEWANKFEGLLHEMPDWYAAPYGTPFRPLYFADDLMSISDSVGRAASTPPRSDGASGGSSGFSSGGGFSGGGFGGGGGGSW